jgi:hypothetical protein
MAPSPNITPMTIPAIRNPLPTEWPKDLLAVSLD